MSPHAQKILSLPYRNVPQLTRFVAELATVKHVTTDGALRLIQAAMRDLKLTDLDVEMCQPEASARAPFVADAGGMDGNQAAIASHVHRMLQGAGR